MQTIPEWIALASKGDVNGALDALARSTGILTAPLSVASGKLAKRLLTRASAIDEELALPKTGTVRAARLKAELKTIDARLKLTTGFTRAQMPRGGWFDKRVGWPVARTPGAVTLTAPSPENFRFGGDTVAAASERTRVAARRKELGFAERDGELIGVHLSLEGGGGKGKRYPSMLKELDELGVVPVSFSGTSAGSIAAAFAAAGATGAQLENIMRDKRMSWLMDPNGGLSGGLLTGDAAYHFIDDKLRELTGITHRPVTFADLKAPLQVIATKTFDTEDPAPATLMDRRFVFSQQTTPDTPVALAVRASISIPGVFRPVNVVDPANGRLMQLVDGGVLDNLPLGYHPDKSLPVIGASLDTEPVPAPGTGPQRAIGPAIFNGLTGLAMMMANGTQARDTAEKLHPAPNHFMLAIPVSLAGRPEISNSTLRFAYNPRVDPLLDAQTREVTRRFIGAQLGSIGLDSTASATNSQPK